MRGLNCKPGDVAQVLSSPITEFVGIVGRFITVTRVLRYRSNGDAMWEYEGQRLRCQCGCGRAIVAIADCVLRPMRGGDGESQEFSIYGGKPVMDNGKVATAKPVHMEAL